MQTLKKNKDFARIYNKAKKYYSRYTIIFESQNYTKEGNFGFVASKKTGNAVHRNRIKRIFREVVRNNEDIFNKNKDYIIVAKAILKEELDTLKYNDFEKDILKVMK